MVKLGCSSNEGLDISLTIYDSNRNKLFDVNNTGSGESEKIPFFMIKNSIYISVSATSLSSSESKYTLDFEQYQSNDTIEIEPNNTKTTANLFNKNITGFITYKNDIDYYHIKYTGRQKVKISVKGVKNGKIRISTTDPLGFIIKSKEIDSDEEITFNEIFDSFNILLVITCVIISGCKSIENGTIGKNDGGSNFYISISDTDINNPDNDRRCYYMIYIDKFESGRTSVGLESQEKDFDILLTANRHLIKVEKWILNESLGRYVKLNNIDQPKPDFIYVNTYKDKIVRVKLKSTKSGISLYSIKVE